MLQKIKALMAFVVFLAIGGLFFFFNNGDNFSAKAEDVSTNTTTTENSQNLINAVYVTGWSAGNSNYFNYLDNLFSATEINSVVIDIKDASGYVFYNANVEEVKEYGLYNYSIKDIDSLIKFFHDRNIYVIARIVVFQDPLFAENRTDLALYDLEQTKNILEPVLWQNNKGSLWVDPAAKDVWDYNIALAKDATLHGFDEINFDYIRFPSDGDLTKIGYPIWDKKSSKQAVLKQFYQYARQQLSDTKISADLFGLSTVNNDDLGIGQVITDALQYFDYVCPMVYPSHYASGFIGFDNPDEYPYWVVKYSMIFANLKRQRLVDKGINMGKLRPWLQDFDLGTVYTPEMVKSQITATQESLFDDYCGFMLWNPSNYYTKEAIIKN